MRQFRDGLRSLSLSLREAVREDSKVNDSPESYRAFAESISAQRSTSTSWCNRPIKFQPAWEAVVPGIDLRSVFMYPDRVVVAGHDEIAAIEKRDGALLWRLRIERGVSIAAPNSIVRLSPHGTLSFHDISTGIVTITKKLAARNGGMPAGAIINVPGLPRLAVVSEGDRFLTAVDYVSGEVRWRYALGRCRSIKVRRVGKLLVVSSSDHSLVALDIESGETVWRVRDKLRFMRPVSFDQDDLFAVTGDCTSSTPCAEVLTAFEPWVGAHKWSRRLPDGLRSVGAPTVSSDSVVVATQDRRGLGLSSFNRADGQPMWSVEPGFVPSGSAWLAVDDTMVINSENGMTVGLDLRDGAVTWRRAMEPHPDGDAPRNLEPTLRCGALFVPQRNVLVLSPCDGEKLGEIDADLVPDVVRVDDDCCVVVVEESGHAAAFSGRAHLRLVKS